MEQLISKELVDACNRAFDTDCDVEDFPEAFTVYPNAEAFHAVHPESIEIYDRYNDCAKIVNGLYIWFDRSDYDMMYAEKAVRKGLVRDDYPLHKNIFLFEPYEVRWVCFYFNGDTGIPCFCENCCYDFVIKEVAEMDGLSDDEFFDRLEEGCWQYVHECSDVELYNAWGREFDRNPDRKLDGQLRQEIINSVM